MMNNKLTIKKIRKHTLNLHDPDSKYGSKSGRKILKAPLIDLENAVNMGETKMTK